MKDAYYVVKKEKSGYWMGHDTWGHDPEKAVRYKNDMEAVRIAQGLRARVYIIINDKEWRTY